MTPLVHPSWSACAAFLPFSRGLPHGLQPANVLLWCRRLRTVEPGVVEERRLASVALERVHDVPLGCVIFPSSAMREHVCPLLPALPTPWGPGSRGLAEDAGKGMHLRGLTT